MNELPLIGLTDPVVKNLIHETQFAPNGIVSRTVFRTPLVRVVLFGFAEGQELTEHTSTAQALVQILSGRCEFTLAGAPRLLQAGDLLYMPPHLPHAVKATSAFSMLLTLIKPAEKEQPPKERGIGVEKITAGAPETPALPSVEVDVRGLEPPQPLVKILEALATLPTGVALEARTDRRPVHLYDQLETRGFSGTTEEQSDGSYLTRIRRA